MRHVRILDLREQRDVWFDRDDLTTTEVFAIADHPMARIQVGWPTPSNSHRWTLRATGWVGTLPVGDRLVLRITPKIPVPRLLELHRAAGGGRDLELFSGLAPTAGVEQAAVMALRILCERVNARMARGLLKGYVAEARSGSAPKGRLRTRDTLLQFACGRPTLVWDERPLTFDIDDNRILAWTLRRAARIPHADTALRSEAVRLERALAACVTVRSFEAAECRGRSFARADADYAELHALCALILEGIGPAAGVGSSEFLAFGADLPALFERAVAVTTAEALGPDLRLTPKPRVPLGQGMAFEPDLVVTDSAGRPLAIMDTKYKEAVLDVDVRQVVAYAAAMRTELAILVYPAPVVTGPLRAGSIRVLPACFDLDAPPAAAAAELAAVVRRLVKVADGMAGAGRGVA